MSKSLTILSFLCLGWMSSLGAPAKTFGIEREDRLAELLSYIRYAWGQEGGPVDKATVSSIKRKHEKRSAPWTSEELKKLR